MNDAAPAAPAAPTAPATAGHVLCRLDDIEDGQAKGFTLGAGRDARELFVVREDGQVFGYVNSCPHLGTPLNWQDDRFISDHSGLILCATHGALFHFADGFCVDGHCVGESLEPVTLVV